MNDVMAVDQVANDNDGRKLFFADIAKAVTSADVVFKDSENQHHGYAYASAEAMIAGTRTMALVGLSVRNISSRLEVFEKPIANYVADAVMVYRTSHGPSGLYEDCEVRWPVIIGRGRDWDKAYAGARTTAYSYHLRDMLMIPREDKDASPDQRDDRDYDPTKPPAVSKAREKAKATDLDEAAVAKFDAAKADILSAIASCADLDSLKKVVADVVKVGFPKTKQYAGEINDAYKARKVALTPPASATGSEVAA